MGRPTGSQVDRRLGKAVALTGNLDEAAELIGMSRVQAYRRMAMSPDAYDEFERLVKEAAGLYVQLSPAGRKAILSMMARDGVCPRVDIELDYDSPNYGMPKGVVYDEVPMAQRIKAIEMLEKVEGGMEETLNVNVRQGTVTREALTEMIQEVRGIKNPAKEALPAGDPDFDPLEA